MSSIIFVREIPSVSNSAFIHRSGVVRTSSQSPLNFVSACGENCARSLAPPLPTQPASLGLRGVPHPLCVCSFPAGQVSPASDWHSR